MQVRGFVLPFQYPCVLCPSGECACRCWSCLRHRAVIITAIFIVFPFAQDAVNDSLIAILTAPSRDPAAHTTFATVWRNDPGPRPEGIAASLARIGVPILLPWGSRDPWTPLDGPVGRFFLKLGKERRGVEVAVVEGAGHW